LNPALYSTLYFAPCTSARDEDFQLRAHSCVFFEQQYPQGTNQMLAPYLLAIVCTLSKEPLLYTEAHSHLKSANTIA